MYKSWDPPSINSGRIYTEKGTQFGLQKSFRKSETFYVFVSIITRRKSHDLSIEQASSFPSTTFIQICRNFNQVVDGISSFLKNTYSSKYHYAVCTANWLPKFVWAFGFHKGFLLGLFFSK